MPWTMDKTLIVSYTQKWIILYLINDCLAVPSPKRYMIKSPIGSVEELRECKFR